MGRRESGNLRLKGGERGERGEGDREEREGRGRERRERGERGEGETDKTVLKTLRLKRRGRERRDERGGDRQRVLKKPYQGGIFEMGMKKPLVKPMTEARTGDRRKAFWGKRRMTAMRRAIQVWLRAMFTTTTCSSTSQLHLVYSTSYGCVVEGGEKEEGEREGGGEEGEMKGEWERGEGRKEGRRGEMKGEKKERGKEREREGGERGEERKERWGREDIIQLNSSIYTTVHLTCMMCIHYTYTCLTLYIRHNYTVQI